MTKVQVSITFGFRIVSTAVLTGVDHFTVHVSDLRRAIDTYGRLGFTVTGEADAAYALFGPFHLEFRERSDPTEPEGLHTLGLRSDDIEADIARLRSVGLPVTDATDDEIVVASTSLPRRIADVDALIPVRLVEHDHGAGDLHSLLGEPPGHPNTVTDLERTYVAVESIEHHLPAFEQVLGIPAPEPEMGTVIMSLMSVFYVGKVGIAIAEPRGAGPTADALAADGPGMFQILLRARHLDVADRFMVDHDMPAPARGTRLSGESALLVEPANAFGLYVAMAGPP